MKFIIYERDDLDRPGYLKMMRFVAVGKAGRKMVRKLIKKSNNPDRWVYKKDD